jgi:hypothetical protein
MDFSAPAAMHQQQPENPSDRLTTEGSFAETVAALMQKPEAQRIQYSAMIGSLVYNHRELQDLVRYLNLADAGDRA